MVSGKIGKTSRKEKQNGEEETQGSERRDKKSSGACGGGFPPEMTARAAELTSRRSKISGEKGQKEEK